MKISKILVPYDFSNCAENALAYALKIRDKTKSTVCVFNISLLPNPYTETDYYYEADIVEEIEQRHLQQLNELKESDPAFESVQIETTSDTSVIRGIKRRVDLGDIDLIVMGTEGIKSLGEILFGSHASELVKETKVPLLVIPEEYHQHKFSKVALAGDYQDIEDPWEIYILADICGAFKAELEIFYVNPQQQPISAEQAFEAAQLGDYVKQTIHSYHEITNKNTEKGILEYIDQHKIDLITMIPRRHSLIEKLFSSSLTKKMVGQLKIPVLVLHDA